MAITSEIIGKLGGAGVEVTPVSGTASGGANSETVLHTAQVPAGEVWLIAAVGEMNPRYSGASNSPSFYIGDQQNNGYIASGTLSMAALCEGEATVRIQRNSGSGTDSFAGHVYTVKM